MPRGCTARNTNSKKKKRKIVLINNSYYNTIIARIDEIEKKHTGQNLLATINHLQNTAESILCKECVTKEIEEERKRCIEIILKHLDKKEKTQSKEGYISDLTFLLQKNGSRRTNKILKSSEIQMKDKTVGLGSQTSFCCAHDHNFNLSPDLTHPDCNGRNFMHYDVNVKSILQGYMNGAAGNSLDTTGVLFDLPRSRNLTRSFSRNQEKVGEHIRATVIKEMDLALKLELKATILYEEREEYDEECIESDENTRK